MLLIEKEEILVNTAVLPLYAVEKKKRRHLSRNRSLLKRHGVELIAGQVLKIDPAGKKIYTDREEISYDLLLIAAGAKLDDASSGNGRAGIDCNPSPGLKRFAPRCRIFGVPR